MIFDMVYITRFENFKFLLLIDVCKTAVHFVNCKVVECKLQDSYCKHIPKMPT